jgi:hypothetical protein
MEVMAIRDEVAEFHGHPQNSVEDFFVERVKGTNPGNKLLI